MDFFVCIDGGIDFFEEGQRFPVTMSIGRMCKHFAAQVVQCGKESHHPMPVVIMVRVRIWPSPSGRPVWVHSRARHWRRSTKPRRCKGVQVKPNDVPVFFLELPDRRTEVCADGVYKWLKKPSSAVISDCDAW
jgi:hypothetical protein